mmetsp:Transcript_31514/g.66284  ORF Transcript_31514/g.66284 Transcript_31514/m.66284 type:complete len:834 (-) Transcript_31514:27-2528(-)
MSSENTQDGLRDANDKGDGDCNDASVASSSAPDAAAVVADTSSTPPKPKKEHKKRKASKGRLKKLWRRAVGSPPGITSRSEWLELEELHSDWKLSHAGSNEDQSGGGCKNDKQNGGGVATDLEAMLGPLPGPSVSLATQQPRDFSQLENWQTTEGSEHRDLLMNLLFAEGGGSNGDIQNNSTSSQKKKKRKLGSTSTKEEHSGNREKRKSSSLINVPHLPSWSNIGNLGSVGGVAVIEVEIIGGESDTTCPLMPSQRIMDSMGAKSTNVWSSLLQPNTSKESILSNDESNEVKRAIGAACKVKLFQGNRQPRCLSDVLMILPPPPAGAKEAKRNGCFDVLLAMNDLLLKPKQLRSEGFPIEVGPAPALTNGATSDETLDPKLARERVCKMLGTIPAGCDALELVNALSVNAVLGNTTQDEDESVKEDDFSKIEHYVKSFGLCRTSNCDSSVTSDSNGDTQKRKIYALDCEMVLTSAGPELARVSVIMLTGGNIENGHAAKVEEEEKSILVMDELVKPRRKVLDYLTEFSGVTPKMLQDVDTRIEHIQARLLSIIDENDFVVGHSCENDMRALRLVHNNIIDTSVIFRGANGRKFSLRHLSNVLLQKKIQQGCGSSGHCSTEDAEAALLLALRRARRGDSFRLKENSNRENILSVFQKINRASNNQNESAESFAARNEGSCVCIGPNEWISKYAQSAEGAHHVLSCDSVMNSMSMAAPSWLSNKKSSKRAGFLWANLRCEDRTAGKSQWKSEVNKMDEIVKALVDRVPYNIPILLLFQSNYKKALALTQQRQAANNPKATAMWTSQREEEWEKYMEECKHCEAIWIGSTADSCN